MIVRQYVQRLLRIGYVNCREVVLIKCENCNRLFYYGLRAVCDKAIGEYKNPNDQACNSLSLQKKNLIVFFMAKTVV